MSLDNPKPQSLDDVLALLTSSAFEDTRQNRARISAIRRIATFLHRPPCDLPTDVRTLRRMLNGLHPAQCGVSRKSLSNVKSNLADALRVAGVLPNEERGCSRTAPWLSLLDLASADQQRWGLSRFVDFCCAQGVEPEDVTQEVFAAYRDHIDDRLLAREPADHCKATATTWNHLIKASDRPFVRLKSNLQKQYRARPLSDYPQSLQDEVSRYLDRLSHANIFDESGPDKPLRPTSLRNIKAHLCQYLDALVSASAAPDDFGCLKDAVSADQMKTAFRTIHARRGSNDIPKGLANIAATLTALAKHHLALPEDQLRQMLAIKKRVSTEPRGMSQKNRERLGQFSDWQNVLLLVSLAPKLMERADQRPLGRNSALEAMYAAALAILLSCPMRVANLASLDLDRHLRPRRNGTRTIYTIRIEGAEVKNGEPIEVDLNSKGSRIVHRYITQYRPQVSDGAGTALFPRLGDGKSRDPSNFSRAILDLIQRETGLVVNVHLFRHFAAMLYLKERPGDFETVRRLLKHKRLQTTMNFYASLSNQWAHEHYDDVVLSKFGGRDD